MNLSNHYRGDPSVFDTVESFTQGLTNPIGDKVHEPIEYWVRVQETGEWQRSTLEKGLEIRRQWAEYQSLETTHVFLADGV